MLGIYSVKLLVCCYLTANYLITCVCYKRCLFSSSSFSFLHMVHLPHSPPPPPPSFFLSPSKTCYSLTSKNSNHPPPSYLSPFSAWRHRVIKNNVTISHEHNNRHLLQVSFR